MVITGGNTGIGKETARILAWRKARVIIGCRNITKGLQAAADIIENTGNRNMEVKKLDLSSFQSVREFAEEIDKEEERVDILINNAGYMGPYVSTVDGLENTVQVNYLSHFLLTHLLLDKLKASSPSRIINVSSDQHKVLSQFDVGKVFLQKKEDHAAFKAYSCSKLCQVYFTREMSKRLKGSFFFLLVTPKGIVSKLFSGVVNHPHYYLQLHDENWLSCSYILRKNCKQVQELPASLLFQFMCKQAFQLAGFLALFC